MVGHWLLMHLLRARMNNRKRLQSKQYPIEFEDTKSSVFVSGFPVKVEIFEPENVQTCRVCLKSGEIPIYRGKSEYLPWALSTFGGIIVKSDDKYPKFLCRSCHELIQGAILLRKTAQQSDKLLKQSQTENLSIYEEVDQSENNSNPDEKAGEFTWSSYCKTSKKGCNTFDEYSDHGLGVDEEENRHNLSSSDKYLTVKIEKISENDGVKDCKNISDPKKKRVQKKTQLNYCKRCELGFNTSAEYKEHKSNEHGKKRRTCPICKKTYAPCYLKMHLDKHKMDYRFICDICGKKFFQRGNFASHRAIHFPNLPFECPHCPYKGRFKDALKMHMRSHTGEKPYPCTQCPTKCTSKSNLTKHMRIHKTDHDYKCSACGKGFHTKIDLDKHFKVEHHGIKEHVCDDCGKAFGYRKQLTKHTLKVHKREKMKCGGMPVYMKVQCQDLESTYKNAANV